MQGSAYGASFAGGAFDWQSFVKQPQTILRFLSWLFAIVVFGTITAEGYVNKTGAQDLMCMFNAKDSACSYGVGIGVLAFLACAAFFVMDAYFPRISNAKERKVIVIGDLIFSAVWTLLWFICFCVLTNLWSHTPDDLVVVRSAGQAVVTFSFFSIVSWALLTYFAYGRYRQGVSEVEEYRDPANDHTTPYPPYASSTPTGYQQSPFPQSEAQPGEYQPPSY